MAFPTRGDIQSSRSHAVGRSAIPFCQALRIVVRIGFYAARLQELDYIAAEFGITVQYKRSQTPRSLSRWLLRKAAQRTR